MNISSELRNRINFQGEIAELLNDVCKSYEIGDFISFEPIESGYEDVNLKLVTSKGNFFVKIFHENRTDAECLRLINIVKIAIDNGVSHPQFLKRDVGYIFRNQYEQFNIRLAVFEFVTGKTFFELKRNPTTTELKEIIKMAAIVNKIDYLPVLMYDRWALVNFPAELEKARKKLSRDDLKLLDKLQKEFELINIKSLPQSLVHGDLISTNIMKDKSKIYFVDFSVANYYPRILELAVLMSDVMFDPKNKGSIITYYKLLINEYQKHLKLTAEELEVLPLFIKLAHAMHYIQATIEKEIKKNKSQENEYWLKIGKKGLEQTSKIWK